MNLENVEVICYEGYASRERPAWVILEGRKLKVKEIVDRWYQGPLKPGPPTINYFRVRLADERIILLRYIPLFDRWALVKPSRSLTPPPQGQKAKIIPFPNKRSR